MKKMMKRLWANEKGFTLIELIIVIAILAIISAIAVPNILSAVDNSRKTADITSAKVIADAASQVVAKYEDASAAAYTFAAPLNVTSTVATGAPGAAGTANDFFVHKFFQELNSNMPKPGFKGTPIVETSFFLIMNPATGLLEVWVGNSAGALDLTAGNTFNGVSGASLTSIATNGRRVYPIADDIYKNK